MKYRYINYRNFTLLYNTPRETNNKTSLVKSWSQLMLLPLYFNFTYLHINIIQCFEIIGRASHLEKVLPQRSQRFTFGYCPNLEQHWIMCQLNKICLCVCVCMYVCTRQSSDVHFLQVFSFQDDNCEFSSSWNITQ